MFDPNKEPELLAALDCDSIEIMEDVQTLWSGYGKILRGKVNHGIVSSVIIKYCTLPQKFEHPRGWNTEVSQVRKMRSYQIEKNWYQQWSHACSDKSRVAHTYWASSSNDVTVIVMEDLDRAGFNQRVDDPTPHEIQLCIRWLANFHATFLMVSPQKENADLWNIGNYWNLQTRQDEWNAMEESALKIKAKEIDKTLRNNQFSTIIHGDSKIANFCFNSAEKTVAAVDFQYVGGGCGIQDVMLFFSSCLSSDDCEASAQEYLNIYFTELKYALLARERTIDFSALEHEWRTLYPMAWADFARFLTGWKPGHWKLNEYCIGQIELALAAL